MARASSDEPPSALEGVRVLDLADHLGAYASRLLADLGADVVKVEPPGGDPSRRLEPLWDGLSLPFVHDNLNKRSIVLDLERPADREQLRALAARADVVISTGSSERWAARGFELARLAEDFPHLVWVSVSPFGLHGPHSGYKGTNIVAEAMAGLMYIQGDDERPPAVSPCEQAVHLANLHAAFGALLGLWERQRSGLGQVVEVSLQEVMAHVHFIVVRYTYASEILRRPGARNPLPPNGYYACQDGHVFISLFLPHQWERLAEWIGETTLLDPAFRDRDYRRDHADLVNVLIQQFAERYDVWSLTEEAQRRGIPAAPLCTVADAAANRHLAERGFFVEFEQPPQGRLRTVGPGFRASATPLRIRRPAPQPGEHQDEVLREWTADPPQRAQPVRDGGRRLPLEGVRILDFSRIWAGPFGTRYLADFGAEVIKVESGQSGDSRRPGDPMFADINRNKRFVTINFQTEGGRELVKRLAAVCDVVVENFSPRVMSRWGIDYEHLREVRPDLIMVSMPGFGKTGPHSHFVSYGGPLMAYTGMALLWGHPDSPPDAHIKIAYPDFIASSTLAVAVMAALLHRARTGQGQSIEIAQVETTIAAMEVAYLDYFANGRVATPQGNRDASYAPQGCYPCRGDDAWCVISCTSDEEWRALARVIGGPELASDPRYATRADRQARHEELDALIAAWTREHTPHQAMRLLQAAGVPAGAVQTGEDLWRDPHLRARGYLITVDHPDLGPVEHPGVTIRLWATPGEVRRPAGRLGQDNEAVFRGLLGLSEAKMAELEAEGALA